MNEKDKKDLDELLSSTEAFNYQNSRPFAKKMTISIIKDFKDRLLKANVGSRSQMIEETDPYSQLEIDGIEYFRI